MVKSSQLLLMCDQLQLTSPEQVLNALWLPSAVLGLCRGQVGSGFRWVLWSVPVTPPCLLQLCCCRCQFPAWPVRTGEWGGCRGSWKAELQAGFCCLSGEDSGLRQCGDVTDCRQLTSAGEIFLPRKHVCECWRAGTRRLCLVRANSVCQGSAPVTAFQHHAGDAGPV